MAFKHKKIVYISVNYLFMLYGDLKISYMRKEIVCRMDLYKKVYYLIGKYLG
jgi:hypothetical protein